MSGTIVRHRFSRGTSGRATIRMAVRYLECRPMSVAERVTGRALFNGAGDHIARTDATSALADVATQRVVYHRLILSPPPAAMDHDDLRRWTRHVLADLERRQGGEVIWVAAVHRHTGHPHVHVLVGATTRSRDGRRRPLRFTPSDYAAMRASGDRWAKHTQAGHVLMRDVERYLAITAREVAMSVGRRSSDWQVRDDEDEDTHRRGTRRR